MERMSRCIDMEAGQKVLSYDLLDHREKHELDRHLETCAACRDFLQQTRGREGAFDDLAARVWRLSQRQRIEPHVWVTQHLRLLVPLALVVALVLGVGSVWLARRGSAVETVKVLRFAVLRGATLDGSTTPRVDVAPEAIVLRTDRDAYVFVYETRADTLRRVLPAGSLAATRVGPAEACELRLPPIQSRESRLLLVLVPGGADPMVQAWDDAVFQQLRAGRNPHGTTQTAWPGGVQPTLRWYP
jgi:hypothetical protein